MAAGPKYNRTQKTAYLAVIFVLFPLVICTGLALSPAMVTACPWLGVVFGGHQSARTIHFVVACLLLLFLCMHVIMVCRAGFRREMRGIILGPIQPAVPDE